MNMAQAKQEMPVQDAAARVANFAEVALGYTAQQAIEEAQRCLNCKHRPCVAGCPVRVNIPAFITEVAKGNFDAAYDIITQANRLPAVCGRVCPQETQCEIKCVRGIKGEAVAIGRLERFVADHHNAKAEAGCAPTPQPGEGIKVAVIGSGPAGLACAGDLAKAGYRVTIFEALHLSGGVLVYGIPEFRLPKEIVRREIDALRQLGVEIRTNMVVGKTITIDELMEEQGYQAVFIGSGAGLPRFMDIPGENLKGVYSANEYLTRINLMKAYRDDSATPIHRGKKVAVIGGGNVAMDAARCARRMGAQVSVVYRRTQKELPARLEEVEHAKEEGIQFLFLTNPVAVNGDENGWVSGLRCQQMIPGPPDKSGRATPIPLYDSDFFVEADCVIVAVGTTPNPLITATTQGLQTQRWGGIVAEDATGLTSRKGVYAGGDAVTGAATVILAMGAGKTAAAAIADYLQGKGASA